MEKQNNIVERKRSSYKRRSLDIMRDIFVELGNIPHEKRKHWGKFGSWTGYDFALNVIDKEVARLDREANRVFLRKGGKGQ